MGTNPIVSASIINGIIVIQKGKPTMIKKLLIGIGAIVIITSACSPSNKGQPPGLPFTQAAQTVQVELTRISSTATLNPIPTSTAIPVTSTSIPTSTFIPSATAIPIPCNMVSYNPATLDVTIPDGTVIAPGSSFTKTWRLYNAGTCPWNSSYQLVFDHGDPMGVAAGYAQSLTTGIVLPGASVDVSVALKAPVVTGDYKGYWRLREPGGKYFGIGNSGGDFWVAITVNAGGNLVGNPVAGESGVIWSNGTISPNLMEVGDTSSNDGLETFLSFDISSIPTGSTIKGVSFDITQGNTVHGDPFTNLGCLYFYADDYGILDINDYVVVPPPGGLTKLCKADELKLVISNDIDWINGVQSHLGSTRFQIRLQFPDKITDSNSKDDYIQLGTVVLTITYQKP